MSCFYLWWAGRCQFIDSWNPEPRWNQDKSLERPHRRFVLFSPSRRFIQQRSCPATGTTKLWRLLINLILCKEALRASNLRFYMKGSCVSLGCSSRWRNAKQLCKRFLTGCCKHSEFRYSTFEQSCRCGCEYPPGRFPSTLVIPVRIGLEKTASENSCPKTKN